ncbi:8808_t:CDS:2 [Scutellospora calospora]|uniref:8808_t:CDS:1 n=1 Tax=Scutellospora calospora TaxID=85575 RepID=A0ACA9KQR0_9GLOM|nr:8808_t:CDS:2 [Scutellospora calospora]
MPSPTDQNPANFNPVNKDSTDIPKEGSIDDTTIVDDTSDVTRNESDVVVSTGSSPSQMTTSFYSDGTMCVTTASSAPAVSSNDAPNPAVPVAQKSSQKTLKQSASHRPVRRTRGVPKTVNVALNPPHLPDSSSGDKKDSVPVSPANVSNPSVSTSSTTPGRSLQPIIPASGSSSLSTNTTRRGLPQKDVTRANIADRYLEFILYCNPSAPSDLDVSSLIRSFNSVPKSDGKTFDTWVLFQLVSKHHSGEIKTWTKLAQQLGVERTNESSPQKIQQYAVRLKKWMRSIHIDAFFDYILSKSNEYYEDPYKNPTGADPGSGADDDDSDLVLKLIRRASSKRQKRKYTRRNTDPESMQLDDSGKRKKSNVQFASSQEKLPKLGKPKNGHIPTPNPSPTTMPDMKLLHNSNVSGDTSHFRVVSNTSGGPATQLRWRSISVGGGPIPTQSGEVLSSQQFSPSVTSTTSPPHKTNTASRRRQSSDTSGHFDSFRLSNKRGQQKTDRPHSPTNTAWPWSNNLPNNTQDNNSGFSYSELLLPPTTVSSDPKETISLFQERLVKAVGMLEDSQRKIEMLENVVRQREDEVRKRVARRLREDVVSLFQRYE